MKDKFQILWLMTVITCLILAGLVNILQPPTPVVQPIVATSVFTYTPTTIETSSPTETQTVTPVPPLAIPSPMYYEGQCSRMASEGDICITEETDLARAIAMTIYAEGGNDPQLAVNLLKIMDNLAYLAWENNWKNIPVHDISYQDLWRNDRVRLLAYLMSRPYTVYQEEPPVCTDRWGCVQYYTAISYPGWNGWALPLPSRAILNYPYGAKMWGAIQDMVYAWSIFPEFIELTLDGKYWFRPNPILENKNIMYVYSGMNRTVPALEDRCKLKMMIQLNASLYYTIYFLDFPYDGQTIHKSG